MLFNNLKKIIKKIPFLWKYLTWFKDQLIILSRLKDVLMMMVMVHIWPEQTYKFSTRKCLPKKENRFSKESKPSIPYDLLADKGSNIAKMKEINVIGRGSSFNLNNLKKLDLPTFLISFWGAVKMDDNGKIFYKHSAKFKPGQKKMVARNWKEYLSEENNKDFIKKNITYVTARESEIELLKRNGHNILSVEVHTEPNGEYYRTFFNKPSFSNMIKSGQLKRISVRENVYRPPLLAPDWVPAGSFISALCALYYYADKINVYGWDNHLNFSIDKMSYWEFLIKMYNFEVDTRGWKAQFEHALINCYYAYQFSKLPNINIYGYMGQLGKHEKLIKKIERVLFN